jgi:hypothetical protein
MGLGETAEFRASRVVKPAAETADQLLLVDEQGRSIRPHLVVKPAFTDAQS